MTTIYDVAKAVGCAPSTVSKYITKNGYVSQQMADKISAAMVKLDYHYNGIARSLSTSTNNRIGIMVPFLDHPYFQSLINAISTAAATAGKEVVILPTSYQAAREEGYLQELEHRLINSLIITSHSLPTEQIIKYQRFGPVIFCENISYPNTNWVGNNRVATLKELFATLQARGLNQLGFLFIRQPGISKSTTEILKAYTEVYQQPVAPEAIVYNCHTVNDGQAACAKLIKANPNLEAVITESDITATGVYQESQREKVSLTIIGQGNHLASQLLHFSSIDQHLDRVGKKAIQLALHPGNSKHEQVNFDIIWR